jgi:uncharacterized protein (DUF2147 family)
MVRSGYFLLLPLLMAASTGHAQGRSPIGVWMHQNQRIQVEIMPCGEQLCGKIVWFKNPTDVDGQPRDDEHNPRTALRSRPLMGMTVLQGMRRAGENDWVGGKIYNPDDGKTYDANLSVQQDGSLRIRAYVATTVLGKTEIWKRVR